MVVAGYPPSLLNFRKHLLVALREKSLVMAVAPNISADIEVGLRALGVIPIDIPMDRSSLNPIGDLKTFFALRRIFLKLRPNVVIPYTAKAVVWSVLAARSAGVKRVVPMVTGLGYAFTAGGGFRRAFSRRVASILYRLALGRSDFVLFQNPDDMMLFRRLELLPTGIPSAVVNGSGVDILSFTPASLPESPSFLMIARLLGDKGVREFGEAARSIIKRHPSAAIRLVGYMDQSPDSITQAELDEIVASGVEFVGRLEDVRPAIAQASVYVLPSYREGTPRSTLEAMAMGRAVITTDAPGCRETVIEGVNGYLVPPRDAVALAAAMEKFIAEPGLAARMGAESRRIAEEKYDVRLVNAEIMRHAGLLP